MNTASWSALTEDWRLEDDISLREWIYENEMAVYVAVGSTYSVVYDSFMRSIAKAVVWVAVK